MTAFWSPFSPARPRRHRRKRQRSGTAAGVGLACAQMVSGGEGRGDRPLQAIEGARTVLDC